ncbi:effector, partial [Candidatus Phytoplasma citri]
KSLLDKDKETKDQEINNLKQVDKRDNKDKIKQLQDELEEIVEQISDINSQICKLEAYQKYYQEILNDSENYKSILEERCEKDKKEYQNSILSELNSLYEIASAEG